MINTFNIAPSWTHIFSPNTVLPANAFVRQDRYHYFPSADPFSDLPATLSQNRHLTNLGARADLSYVKGAHNIKAGVQLQHWFLKEVFALGVTDQPGLLHGRRSNQSGYGSAHFNRPCAVCSLGIFPQHH